MRAREWRGETLSESDAAERRAFYARLERIEEGYLAESARKRQDELHEREQTLAALETLLMEKRTLLRLLIRRESLVS